jgi:hypothetical protein
MCPSELISLRWCDIVESDDYVTVTIQRSKTDQIGAQPLLFLVPQNPFPGGAVPTCELFSLSK